MPDPTVLFSRVLPGGGFVAVETETVDGGEQRAWVAVERRTDPVRRIGHVPPVIASVAGNTISTTLQSLYGIATDNVAVARGLIRWEADRMEERD